MRFARASGSKASNERLPNEATPWHIMKEQLMENQSKNEKPTEKVKSAKELLKEREDLLGPSTNGNQNNWAEFEEVKAQKAQKKKAKKLETQSPKMEKQLQNKKGKSMEIAENAKHNPVNVKSNEQVVQTTKGKKKKPLKSDAEIVHSKQTVAIETKEEGVIPKKKKAKKRNNKAALGEAIQQGNTVETPNEEDSTLPNKKRKQSEGKTDEDVSANKEVLTKRQKRNLKRKNKNSDENAAEERNGTNEQPKPFPNKFNKDFPNRQNGFNNDYNKFDQFPPKKIPRNNHTTPGKVRDDQEHARRKPDSGPLKLIINGVEVELVKYDGFPVKKEDAERLKDLRQQMVMKGIPKKDIDAAMKLERRRAEKALARIRREVCYHCRKAGHILSDCPELGVEQAGTGICFKCGSTEHTHFECKVAKATEYRFAKCFICREQGHIAKQCPDNPKGVYPQGGACKVCGDVTHLKKDCPDLIKEKEETALTVDTITDDTLESLDNERKKIDASEETSRKKKVVKF